MMTPTMVLEVAGFIALGNFIHVRKLNKVTQLKGALTLVRVKLSHRLKLNLIIKSILMSQRMESQKTSVTRTTSPN